jgi:NADH-quinone oxidoreductase subunit L
MLVRVGFLIQASPPALSIIAWIGTITAVMAALIATQQNDIKRILAYSTLSQLGYMVLAVGLASGEAAMFHLFTHAFFKALLFLGAGSIIVMLQHEQNIWKMGGLAGRLGITFLTFMVGTLALIGFPPFSGFFSKDAILALAYEKNRAIFWLALFTAFLTAFYMIRLIVVVFFGRPRSNQARAGREAPWIMITPLMILAIPALGSGFDFVAKIFVHLPAETETGWLVPGLALAATLTGITMAILLYRRRESDPIDFALFRKGFYFDALYGFGINATQGVLARISVFIDRWILDFGVVRGASGATWGFGSLLRLLQVGNLQAYSFLFGLGIVVLIYFTLFR